MDLARWPRHSWFCKFIRLPVSAADCAVYARCGMGVEVESDLVLFYRTSSSLRTVWPGARGEHSISVLRDGSTWLFGGSGYAIVDELSGALNDLWRYEYSGSQELGHWVWKGPGNRARIDAYSQAAAQGHGVAWPGARVAHAAFEGYGGAWPSSSLCVFGGRGFAHALGSGLLNDLWYALSTHTECIGQLPSFDMYL